MGHALKAELIMEEARLCDASCRVSGPGEGFDENQLLKPLADFSSGLLNLSVGHQWPERCRRTVVADSQSIAVGMACMTRHHNLDILELVLSVYFFQMYPMC